MPHLPPRSLGGAIPWEKMLVRAGAWARLQLPVWGSQGHWCSHLQGIWQPGPCQPRGHSVERRQKWRPQWQDLSLHRQDGPQVCAELGGSRSAPGVPPG